MALNIDNGNMHFSSPGTQSLDFHFLNKRSEERRVGKECRYRWSQ